MKNSGVSLVTSMFIACIPIIVIAQTWEAVLPQDPTVSLNDLCFQQDGLHGWSVGATSAGGQTFSVVFRTSDGTNWEYVPFTDSTSAALNGVCFVSPTHGWVVGHNGRIYATSDGGDSWSQQSSGTSRVLQRVHFINEDRGWAVGGWGGSSFLVLRTTNGGATWQNLSFGTNAYSVADVYFTDSLHGWICGRDNTLEPHIHHTTDGGTSWTRQIVPAGAGAVDAIDFPNLTHGWATTSSIYNSPAGAILHTTDGGANWDIQGYTYLDYNHCLDCQDTLRIAIAATQVLSPADARVFVTSNGGQTWTSHSYLIQTYTQGIQYIEDDIWVAAFYSQILKSTDNGSTFNWSYKAPGWNSLTWADSLHGYLVTGSNVSTDGYCMRSTDAGVTWYYDPVTPGGAQVQFIDANHGWVLREGNTSGVYRTSDAGVSWTFHSIGTGAWIGGMYFVSPDSGWAFGSNGAIYFTSTGGVSWTAQSSGTSNYVSTVHFYDALEGWAAGGYGGGNGFIRHTTDGGATWNAQSPAMADHFLCSYFVDRNLGLLGSINGNIQRTTDGGATWQFAQNVPHYYVSAIVMTDTLNGWLSAYNYWGSNPGEDGRGFIYKTTSGGESWILEYTTPRIRTFLTNLTHHHDDVFWVCGYHNTLMKYDPGTGIEYHTVSDAHDISLRITPNPFSTLTEISVGMGHSAKSMELKIYNTTGRLVKSFPLSIAYSLLPTPVVWDGTDHTGRKMPSGVYLITVKHSEHVRTEKVLLIR
ncbi:MAG: T9SS type A sorting domain-containing protein [candidate division WOR-3 bacterium]|nr:MAG: T9SS type A sorting domain-containing protein [candidate division WOR-3 bacterium]